MRRLVVAGLVSIPSLGGFFSYDVAPDKRFLLNVIPDTALPVNVLRNWQGTVRK